MQHQRLWVICSLHIRIKQLQGIWNKEYLQNKYINVKGISYLNVLPDVWKQKIGRWTDAPKIAQCVVVVKLFNQLTTYKQHFVRKNHIMCHLQEAPKKPLTPILITVGLCVYKISCLPECCHHLFTLHNLMQHWCKAQCMVPMSHPAFTLLIRLKEMPQQSTITIGTPNKVVKVFGCIPHVIYWFILV